MARGLPESSNGDFRLISPHPFAAALPGVYREAWLDDRLRYPLLEPFGPRFLSAFDDVLAPILSAIDNLDAYLDPATTPDDFLAWLGQWVAASVDETWPEGRRAFVAQAADLYRRRGTAAGLKEHVEIQTGGTVELSENGASAWSAVSGGMVPGTAQPMLVVTVRVDDPEKAKPRIDALVQAAKPAHVPHRVEVLARTGSAAKPGARSRKAGPTTPGEAG